MFKSELNQHKKVKKLLLSESKNKNRKLEMVEPIFDYQFRLILIGDSTVGKSSLLKYFTDGKFAEVFIQINFILYYCCCYPLPPFFFT